jgi:hypothetical protein
VGEWDAKLYEVDGFEYITRHRNSRKKKKGHPFPQEDPFGNMDYETYFSTSSKDMDKGTYFRTRSRTTAHAHAHATQQKRACAAHSET